MWGIRAAVISYNLETGLSQTIKVGSRASPRMTGPSRVFAGARVEELCMSAKAQNIECKSCELEVESDGGACVPCSLMITANVIQGGIDHKSR